ncbi:MAG: hypothetical protein NT170_02395 [Candidatus Moranbacteria bacterium]|nr:hypothetical protein [Candidatus Moranbacteria bacterium]
MYLKNWLWILVGILAVVGITASAFAETATEQYNRRVSGNGWTPEQEKCYQSTGKYYHSVVALDNLVREGKADVIRREAEVEAREQAQLQQQQSVPPAGEFAPVSQPEQLVYRNGYYPYLGGVVIVSGWYPAWWSWPSWWYVGLPSYNYPVYGWCRGRWDQGRQSVVVNNIMVSKGISSDSFQRDMGRAFSERHVAPEFTKRSPAFRPGIASEHVVGRPATQGVLNSGQRGHRQQFQPRQAMQEPRPQNMQRQPQGQLQPRGNNAPVVRQPQVRASQNFGRAPQPQMQPRMNVQPVPAPRPQAICRPQMQVKQTLPPAKQQNNAVQGGRR